MADCKLNGKQIEVIPGRIYCPVGWVPMYALRGAEIGGDAANMRLWELKQKVPIIKRVFFYESSEGDTKLICYEINLQAKNIERLIDFEKVCIREELVVREGGQIVTWFDNADGHDTTGRAVKIVRRNEKSILIQPSQLKLTT